MYTLYGTEGEEDDTRGLLPRFAEDIFASFDKQRRENSSLSCELEAIDISSETYVDLLASRRNANISISGVNNNNNNNSKDELKLIHTELGPKLQGVRTVEVKNANDLIKLFAQLHRIASKRTSTHTIKLLFTETFEFDNPDESLQPIRKSRRVRVLFVLLRNMPSAFLRCVDVAVEHDSGENPLAKVPIRESAFTKLYPDILQQGFLLNMVCCISPYYEHVRENFNTMLFAMKVKRLLCMPKLIEDESLVAMRRLADEVKNLRLA
uniref:Kinesin-like protein KIF13B n=1 Tax=Lygus hesperus TaxID=30085 RepID=A0A0A9X681_LYGHE